MIVSHKYKFIFWKPHKVAGTSILLALRDICGDEDIVGGFEYGISEADGGSGVAIPPNNIDQLELHKTGPGIGPINHIHPSHLRRALPSEVWDNYTKFTVVRNPWDRVVSQFLYRATPQAKKIRPEVPLSKVISNSHEQNAYYFNYCNKTSNILGTFPDITLRFENLESDFKELCTKLELPDISLPVTRKVEKKANFSYRDYYDSETRAAVAEQNSVIINEYGYSF